MRKGCGLTDLVQLAGHGADDGLVSEVQVETLKVHLPVNPLITHRLAERRGGKVETQPRKRR